MKKTCSAPGCPVSPRKIRAEGRCYLHADTPSSSTPPASPLSPAVRETAATLRARLEWLTASHRTVRLSPGALPALASASDVDDLLALSPTSLTFEERLPRLVQGFEPTVISVSFTSSSCSSTLSLWVLPDSWGTQVSLAVRDGVLPKHLAMAIQEAWDQGTAELASAMHSSGSIDEDVAALTELAYLPEVDQLFTSWLLARTSPQGALSMLTHPEYTSLTVPQKEVLRTLVEDTPDLSAAGVPLAHWGRKVEIARLA